MKKVSGLILDQDEIATAVCEFVAKIYPDEYTDVRLEDVCFVDEHFMVEDGESMIRYSAQVRKPVASTTND